MSSAIAKTDVLVTVTDESLKDIQKVATALRDAGLTVDHVMELVGTIAGSIDRGKVTDLSKIPGVAAVEPAKKFQIAPPDSDVQ
jgi:hypothetical protein